MEPWLTFGLYVCLQILPAACEVIPSMVLVFKLIALPGHGSHISSAMAWGTFPVCGPSLGHVQGRCVKGRSKIAVGPQRVCILHVEVFQVNRPPWIPAKSSRFDVQIEHLTCLFDISYHLTSHKKCLKCFILSIENQKKIHAAHKTQIKLPNHTALIKYG